MVFLYVCNIDFCWRRWGLSVSVVFVSLVMVDVIVLFRLFSDSRFDIVGFRVVGVSGKYDDVVSGIWNC